MNEPAITLESDTHAARRIRHSMSSGLTFIETAAKNLSSNQPDFRKALNLHAVGTKKLHDALLELDLLVESLEGAPRSATGRVNETVG